LVTMMEAAKTVNLLADAWKSFYRIAAISVRDLSRKQLNRFFDEVAGVWMQWRYGLRPTLYEIEDHQKALQEQLFKISRPTRQRAKRGTSFKETSYSSFTSFDGSSWRYKTVTRTRIEVKSYVWSKIPKSAVETFAQSYGFGNLASSLWEATPYSFCVDWVLNIGDFIAQWERYDGNVITDTCNVITTRVETETYIDSLTSVSTTQTTRKSGSIPSFVDGQFIGKQVKETVVRQAGSPRPLTISLDIDFDLFKFLDSVVLVRNFLGKKGTGNNRV